MKHNFKGWATKYGVLCSDGRTIMADAFQHQDTARLPLLWRHDDKTPENVLGHVVLEHVDGKGVKAMAYFNETPRGQHSRVMVEHEDIDSLSIKAVRLKQNGSFVTGGDLTEVSLVPHGANHEARIEQVYLQHEDGTIQELEHEAIIYAGVKLELEHADDDDDEPEDDDSDDSDDSDDGDDQTIQQVYDTMTDEQKLVVDVLVNAASKGTTDEAEQEDSDEDPENNLNHEGEIVSKRNVFDQGAGGVQHEGSVLTHEQTENIFQAAMAGKAMLSDVVLQHAQDYGITNIESLFPEPKNVQSRPEWIKRDDSWVAGVLSGVKHSPFSRIKSRSADVTHEEARARGYIKGNLKKTQFFAISGRTTEPTTIYKKQKLDRDDMLDVTDFDVVAWIKEEMRWFLQEELARAILFGDNRPVEDPANPGEPNPDKIDETKIRPIATDEDFYTAKVTIGTGTAAKDLMKVILRSRKLLKGGSGKPTLYTEDDLIIDMLLMEDKLGRRYYESEAALATALGVKNIVDVDVLEEGYADEDGNVLRGVLVNINDYTLGADRGGQTQMFDDFDIDYNQYKWLIETRRSGALTKHRSAVSLWESAGTEVFPVAPTRVGDDVEIPTVTGVEYWTWTGTNDAVKQEDGAEITIGAETLYVEARPADGYRLPFNTTTDWSYAPSGA